MKLIVCLDDNGGMAYNKRRQTRDVEQRRHLNRELLGKTLWLTEYSKKLFAPDLTDVKLCAMSVMEEENEPLPLHYGEAEENNKPEVSDEDGSAVDSSKASKLLVQVYSFEEFFGDDYVLSELEPVEMLLSVAEEVLVYWWNRTYPDDVVFPIEKLEGFYLVESEEFVGSSHECIRFERYRRK